MISFGVPGAAPGFAKKQQYTSRKRKGHFRLVPNRHVTTTDLGLRAYITTQKNMPKNNNSNNHHHVVGRPYYDNSNGTGLCPVCIQVWELHEQVMYTTKNGTKTYGICPQCLIKHPLRKKPRTRTGFIKRFPPKRID